MFNKKKYSDESSKEIHDTNIHNQSTDSNGDKEKKDEKKKKTKATKKPHRNRYGFEIHRPAGATLRGKKDLPK